LVMIALPTQREALVLRDTLRAQQPDWVVDLNARSLPLQSQIPSSANEIAPRLYALKMLNVQSLPVQPAGSSEPLMRLGVMDTAFDPALTQPQRLNGSQIMLRSVLTPADKPADAMHGNAVLQLLASAASGNGFSGAAPPMAIAWVNVMREVTGKPRTNSLSMSLGLDWLVSQRVTLINMSLGGQGDAVLKAVIERVLAKNIAVIAAAGNNPAQDAPAVYPAAYAGVWAVTAVDAAGKLYSGASRASYTLLAAPGVEVWVPGLPQQEAAGTSNASGSYLSGSSYAAALASAALAWQPAQFWEQSSEQRRALLCAQALKLPDSAWLGCGLVQKVSAKTQP
jgi:Subtilase family